jgi:hydrogenase maturation protein HypF
MHEHGMSVFSESDLLVASEVLLSGQVQGVGFRPALARLASQFGLSGWVRNTSSGVLVHFEGPAQQVQECIELCESICPPTGSVRSKEVRPVDAQSLLTFSIESGAHSGALSTIVPADLVTCKQCMDEVGDPSNRRFGYMLTSCCECGPRYTILEAMPYERETTSMQLFDLCSDCRDEYTSPTNRRFHAQTICCEACGPRLENLKQGLESLRDGKVVCIKGIGGYQLLVDANNAAAINQLRMVKSRQEKPFAVMVSSIQHAEKVCELQDLERNLLQSSAAPIVVVKCKKGCFAEEVLRGLQSVGLMLPTTPLHHWLTREIGALVVTSGNLEGDPIAFRDDQEFEFLKRIADVCIEHDRLIHRPIDDSVVRVMGEQPITLRLARGLAPHALQFDRLGSVCNQQILAVGSHQKVAIALANGVQQVLGPHLGDMDTLACRQWFDDHVEDLTRLYQTNPEVIVHDLHDDYFTTRWSIDYANEKKIRTLAVQHHHAHVVAGMIEPGWLDRTVLGVAWDGTGLGTDSTIWGGEFLKATATGFERVACLRPFPMPGGEAAIREPWRLAVALVREVRAWDNRVDDPFRNSPIADSTLAHTINAPITSSVGRLFDAVGALILPDKRLRVGRAGYEGHFAALLESCCDPDATGIYPMPIDEPTMIRYPNGKQLQLPQTLDWRFTVRAILEDASNGVPESTIAMRFHRTLAFAIRQVADLNATLPVVLGGGVFQNKILVDLVVKDFADRSVPIAIPSKIPINDGGIAAGQLAIASAILAKEQRCA